METMKRQQEEEDEDESTTGVTASSWSEATTPSRPPRRRKKKSMRRQSRGNSRSQSMEEATAASQMDTTQDEDATAALYSTSKKKKQQQLVRSHSAKASEQGDSYRRRVKRSESERRSIAGSEGEGEGEEGEGKGRRKPGDIYTKVAMPRSKSFMNVSGPYNLQELFRELKEKEGIESVDDILRHVISRDGMSFNRTSPMYRELLMKLAMSLSADEMFIRSKNIMMQEKMQKSNSVSREESSAFAKVFSLFGLRNRQQQQQHHKLGANSQSARALNKADIGGPLPMSEEAKRELTKQWMKVTPAVAPMSRTEAAAVAAMSTSSSSNNSKSASPPTSAAAATATAAAANEPSPRKYRKAASSAPSQSAVSCSECGGYQSTSAASVSQFSYSQCSCSMTTGTARNYSDGESSVPSSASAMK